MSSCSLSRNAVHLWRAALDVTNAQLESFLGMLGKAETERAERFKNETDLKRYLVCHGILRSILGRYLKLPPHRVEYSYGYDGKPRARSHNGGLISFNMSHSRGMALFAIAGGPMVGVDLEFIQPVDGLKDITTRFFAADEISILLGSNNEIREEVFYRHWTLKEAYIKALGEGMQCPLDKFSVLPCLQGNSECARIVDRGGGHGEWTLRTVIPGPGYIGALAFEGGELILTRMEWEGIRGNSAHW
jgi:4'-phosphopantetheinyl transferase